MALSKLLKELGAGARTNKFRILIPIGNNGETFDILCHTAQLPGKTIVPVDIVSKGRKYQMRGEVTYDGSWSAEIYNSESMNEYKLLISWMKEVHEHEVYREGILGGLTLGGVNVSKAAQGITAGINQVANIATTNPLSILGSIINGPGAYPSYMRNIRIQMLGGDETEQFKQGFAGFNKDFAQENIIAEVLLMGVFPKEVAPIELTSETGDISLTNITFAYSDIQFGSDVDNLLGDLLGTNLSKSVDNGTNTVNTLS